MWDGVRITARLWARWAARLAWAMIDFVGRQVFSPNYPHGKEPPR